MTSILPWLVGTKHFTESKTLPKIQKHVPEEDEFWILERVFGFWNVFLDFGTCFWILGSVLSLRATVIRSDYAGGQEQKCSLQCCEPNTLLMQIPRKKHCFVLFVVVKDKQQYRGLVIHSGHTEYLNLT